MESPQQSKDPHNQHQDNIPQTDPSNNLDHDTNLQTKDSIHLLEDQNKPDNMKWRVKLYKLNKQGNWDDISTGFVSVVDSHGEKSIEMTSEDDQDSKITISIRDHIFRKQRGTIISWRSSDTSDDCEDDIAMSFQDRQATTKIWKLICLIHQKNENISNSPPQEPQDYGLSEVEISNLPLIAQETRPENSNPMVTQRIIEKLIENQGKYLLELNELFYKEEKRILENDDIDEGKKTTAVTNDHVDMTEYEEYEEDDSYNYEQVIPDHKQGEQTEEEANNKRYLKISFIFTIYKNILSLANHQLMELLLSDTHYLGTFACLECKGFF